MRLLLIRHAETTANAERLLDTAPPGTDLSERGRVQAEQLVEALADVPVDAIYVSDLVRTQQTAAPLAAARGLVPLIRPGIREIQAGEYEMAPDDGSWGAYLAVLYRWADGEPHARIPRGESGIEVLARYDAVVAEAAEHEAAAIISDGAVIRAWTGGPRSERRPGLRRRHPASQHRGHRPRRQPGFGVAGRDLGQRARPPARLTSNPGDPSG